MRLFAMLRLVVLCAAVLPVRATGTGTVLTTFVRYTQHVSSVVQIKHVVSMVLPRMRSVRVMSYRVVSSQVGVFSDSASQLHNKFSEWCGWLCAGWDKVTIRRSCIHAAQSLKAQHLIALPWNSRVARSLASRASRTAQL